MTAREEKTASDCLLDAAITCAVRAAGVSPEIACRSVKGPAAKILVEHSRQAELLVIGRNHRSGVVDILRHSVSAECVRRAACPVVIIPNLPVGVPAPKVNRRRLSHGSGRCAAGLPRGSAGASLSGLCSFKETISVGPYLFRLCSVLLAAGDTTPGCYQQAARPGTIGRPQPSTFRWMLTVAAGAMGAAGPGAADCWTATLVPAGAATSSVAIANTDSTAAAPATISVRTGSRPDVPCSRGGVAVAMRVG